MVRRAGTTYRSIRLATAHHENGRQSRAQLAKQARLKAIDFLSELEDGADDDKEDKDPPRVAQWIDDDDVEQEPPNDASDSDGFDDNDHDHSASEAGPSRRLQSLQDDLSTLPLGTLRNAQRSLAQPQALSDVDLDSEEQSDINFSTPEDDDPSPHQEKLDQPFKAKSSIIKRPNKHAPVEVTSKRPVSRRRVVVDDKLLKPRDPRFMHATGRYEPSKFKQQYEFLSGLRSDELAVLRGHLKRAYKLLANSPSHMRVEREEEVKRLEHAVKRAESAVNLDNRERVELEALQSAKQTEKEKRKQGKGGWWMKRSAKKELLTKAHLDATALVGGKQAVRKAIEKKQKKMSQKEKKMRPFPWGEGIEQSDGKKRRPVESVDPGRAVKRRKGV